MSIKVFILEDESISREGITEYAEYDEVNDKNLSEAAEYGNEVLLSLDRSNGTASDNKVWLEVNGVKEFCPIYQYANNPSVGN